MRRQRHRTHFARRRPNDSDFIRRQDEPQSWQTDIQTRPSRQMLSIGTTRFGSEENYCEKEIIGNKKNCIFAELK